MRAGARGARHSRRRRSPAACRPTPAGPHRLTPLHRSADAGEQAQPRVWQAREQTALDEYDAVTGDAWAAAAAAVGTDFAAWAEPEVRAFLEQRGEDYDDCPDFAALVRGGCW